MSVWDLYENRTETRGKDKKEIMRIREERFVNRHIGDNLSYHSVTIDDIDRDVVIIASDNLNEKTILSLPGEDLLHGGLVHWMDNYWLITERDADTTLYTRAKMIQCNHLLKWVSDDDVIHEQWCIIEDGTKLKRVQARNSLAHWKRCVITIPLIAGNPLELYCYNARMKYA